MRRTCTSRTVLNHLRKINAIAALAKIKVADAEYYVAHGLRQGNAQALLECGFGLHQILNASAWVSPAFSKCIDPAEVVQDSVCQAHAPESCVSAFT